LSHSASATSHPLAHRHTEQVGRELFGTTAELGRVVGWAAYVAAAEAAMWRAPPPGHGTHPAPMKRLAPTTPAVLPSHRVIPENA